MDPLTRFIFTTVALICSFGLAIRLLAPLDTPTSSLMLGFVVCAGSVIIAAIDLRIARRRNRPSE